MTAKEKEAVYGLIGSVRSTVSNLIWYAHDYDSKEIQKIADDLNESLTRATKKLSKK